MKNPPLNRNNISVVDETNDNETKNHYHRKPTSLEDLKELSEHNRDSRTCWMFEKWLGILTPLERGIVKHYSMLPDWMWNDYFSEHCDHVKYSKENEDKQKAIYLKEQKEAEDYEQRLIEQRAKTNRSKRLVQNKMFNQLSFTFGSTFHSHAVKNNNYR